MVRAISRHSYLIDAMKPTDVEGMVSSLSRCAEVHHIGAMAFSSAMFGIACPFILGLSATPDRKDGLSRVMHWFMGPIAFQFGLTGQAHVKVDIMRTAYDDPVPLNRRGDVCFASMITNLAESPHRTQIIVAAAKRASVSHDVLVLSHRREHCKVMCKALCAQSVDAAVYLGGDATCPQSKVVVATYALASEGFDCPRLTALVLATPASDVVQACGRIMRGGNVGSKCLIVDVLDDFGIAYAMFAKRKKYYTKVGFAM